MSRAFDLVPCEECSVEIGPVNIGDHRLCGPCFDRCFAFVHEDDREEEEPGAA